MKNIRILSIDPGVTTCGISIVDLDENDFLHVIYCDTINTTKSVNELQYVEYVHGRRFAKIQYICTVITNLLIDNIPNIVAIESPYINPAFPDAYGALVELLALIKNTVFNYDPSLPVELIPPSSVKQAVGVSGTSGDKSLILLALQRNNMLLDHNYFNVLDEHSLDSLAVAVAVANRFK